MDAAAAKLFCSEMVGRVADRAVQIFGGSGYVADYGIERFYRDVRIFRLYEGTSEIQRLIIAREMMKRGSLNAHEPVVWRSVVCNVRHRGVPHDPESRRHVVV